MLNLTPLARPFFAHRAAATTHWNRPEGMERTQRAVLNRLLHRGENTTYGRANGLSKRMDYRDFAALVPVVSYEDVRPYVMRMVQGEPNVLWPGICRRFAQSSGTSGGKSKYIPITDDSLYHNHYAGSSTAVAFYLNLYRESRLFSGKSFILGGSYANELETIPAGVHVGDLSATLIDCINPVVNLFRVPDKKTALLSDWKEKLPRLIAESAHCNITNISGVPSWFLTVLRGVLDYSKADNIHQVWPELEVFFHGGIAFGPYRRQYDGICGPSMRYIENYNASEGFFAAQDTLHGGTMRLIPDIGVFYEFIPVDNPTAAPVPAWEVEPGRIYSMLISACNGLWRYEIGDTVRIESVEPLRISIAGRTAAFINAFGEELMVWNADKAIEEVCHATGASVANYTAAPIYAACGEKGHHQWLIEWTTPPAAGVEDFADKLDAELCRLNSDYAAKRSGNLFLGRLDIVEVPHGTFDLWLASTGKLGGQRKVPRLSNDRRIADAILSHLAQHPGN